jgi:translation initiation factor 3 subunit L
MFLAGGNANLELQLPNQWLWDIIDEFIYQFQSWCQFAPKAKPEELAQAPQAWNVVSVLNFLQALITKSNILKFLERERLGQEQPYVFFSRTFASKTL